MKILRIVPFFLLAFGASATAATDSTDPFFNPTAPGQNDESHPHTMEVNRGRKLQVVEVAGGATYPGYGQMGHDPWGAISGMTQVQCYEWCRNEPTCKSADYLKTNGDCWPSDQGDMRFVTPSSTCDHWVKHVSHIPDQGCWKDKGSDRAMTLQYFSQELDVQECINHCENKGYNFAGLQNGLECYCGDNEAEYKKHGSSNGCNKNCGGNCGGWDALTVYSVDTIPNLGCFKDTGSDRAMALQYFSSEMNVQECINHCFTEGHNFAGLENGLECYCADTDFEYQKHGSVNGCNKKCGKSDCGGWDALTVYSSVAEHKTAQPSVTPTIADSSAPSTTPIPTIEVAGGTVYAERCVPGYNDWGTLEGMTQVECYEWCRDEPTCKTADYLDSKCFPSMSGYDRSEPYENCYMWVKDDPVWTEVAQGGSRRYSETNAIVYDAHTFLRNGMEMQQDERITLKSGDLVFYLQMQGDGNLVLLDEGWSVLWASGVHQSSTSKRYRTILQDDGNLVTYSSINSGPSTVEWASNSHGTPDDYQLVLTPDRNGLMIVEQSNREIIWSTVSQPGSFPPAMTPQAMADLTNHGAVIRRTCPGCADSHKEIFYKRITPVPSQSDFDAHQPDDFLDLFTQNWFKAPSNELNVDFKLYSSYEDALFDVNAWTFCNYDDSNVGFPRDCGPTRAARHQWNSKTAGGAKDYTLYVSQAHRVTPPVPETSVPSTTPSVQPSVTPTIADSSAPSTTPSAQPSVTPTIAPTDRPTFAFDGSGVPVYGDWDHKGSEKDDTGKYFLFIPSDWEAVFGSLPAQSVLRKIDVQQRRNGEVIWQGQVAIWVHNGSRPQYGIPDGFEAGRRNPPDITANGQWQTGDIIVPLTPSPTPAPSAQPSVTPTIADSSRPSPNPIAEPSATPSIGSTDRPTFAFDGGSVSVYGDWDNKVTGAVDVGKYFLYIPSDWETVFGPLPEPGTTGYYNVTQQRNGVKIWDGQVAIWVDDADDRVAHELPDGFEHGRRDPGNTAANGQWQTGDILVPFRSEVSPSPEPPTIEVAGGTVYEERCVPGYNDWGTLEDMTQVECYEWCRDEPTCKTADYLDSKCFPSKSGYDRSEPYENCYMWVKDVPNGGSCDSSVLPSFCASKHCLPFPNGDQCVECTMDTDCSAEDICILGSGPPYCNPVAPPPTAPTAPPPTPGTGGDPHITTWTNEHFEYHGQCDLVLAKDPEFADGLGLEIHIRTKLVRFWSYIKTVAIKIGNDILEVEGSASTTDAEAHYWFNYEYQGEFEDLAGFPVTQTFSSVWKRHYMVDLSPKYPGKSIVFEMYKEFVRVRFNGADEESFGKTVGLMGDFKTGKTLARDGSTVMDDFTEFGDEWQVLPSEPRLFHTFESPQFPEICIKPEDPRGERRRRLAESHISIEQAEAACGKSLADPLSIKDCVYDILATQDLGMVGAF